MREPTAIAVTPAADGKASRKAGRPPQDTPKSERQNSIAAAALQLFSEFGFDAVSNKDLGAAAGINPALIYYYFEDKDDLFRFVVRKALADALAAYEKIRQEQVGIGSLEAWLSSNLLLVGDISRFLKVIVDYAHSPRRCPETDEAIARFYDTEVRLLGTALLDEYKLAPVDAANLAELMSVFLDGVMVARAVRPQMIDTGKIVDVMRGLLRPKG
jgi:AcrR family transcriptional regulator